MERVLPVNGGEIDGVSLAPPLNPQGRQGGGIIACPGVPVLVEAGGAFSTGVGLSTLADGRVVQHTSGFRVLRSLQSSGAAGALVWCVFTHP